jgi:hypothetical protein
MSATTEALWLACGAGHVMPGATVTAYRLVVPCGPFAPSFTFFFL